MGLLKTVASTVLSRSILIGRAKRFVFLYHDISDQDSPQHSPLYSTPPQRFRAQIDLLARHFRFVPLDEIVSIRSANTHRLASLTFDDGFLSLRDEALPYLQAKGIPVTVFLNTTAIRDNHLFYGADLPSINRTYGRKVFLDEADVRHLVSKGVVIGNHSATHRILGACDKAALKAEIFDCKQYLERLTGTPITHFALPFGKREHYNERVLDACYSAGHTHVYSTNPSCFDLTNPGRDRRLIPRVALLGESAGDLYFVINRPLLKTIDI